MRPTAMMASSPMMKINVGNKNARALSPSPRRFNTVMMARMPKTDRHRVGAQARKGRRQTGDARGDRDGDGERVVDDE